MERIQHGLGLINMAKNHQLVSRSGFFLIMHENDKVFSRRPVRQIPILIAGLHILVPCQRIFLSQPLFRYKCRTMPRQKTMPISSCASLGKN